MNNNNTLASAQAICYAAPDVKVTRFVDCIDMSKEGVAAVKEKRKPVFHK